MNNLPRHFSLSSQYHNPEHIAYHLHTAFTSLEHMHLFVNNTLLLFTLKTLSKWNAVLFSGWSDVCPLFFHIPVFRPVTPAHGHGSSSSHISRPALAQAPFSTRTEIPLCHWLSPWPLVGPELVCASVSCKMGICHLNYRVVAEMGWGTETTH